MQRTASKEKECARNCQGTLLLPRLGVGRGRMAACGACDAEDRECKQKENGSGWRAGWREFVTLTALFDCDAGFLVNDTVVFSADVLVLRESSEARSVRPLCPQRARFSGVESFKACAVFRSSEEHVKYGRAQGLPSCRCWLCFGSAYQPRFLLHFCGITWWEYCKAQQTTAKGCVCVPRRQYLKTSVGCLIAWESCMHL